MAVLLATACCVLLAGLAVGQTPSRWVPNADSCGKSRAGGCSSDTYRSDPTPATEWPWIGHVYLNNPQEGDYIWKCASNLVDPAHLITAARCIPENANLSNPDMQVVLGLGGTAPRETARVRQEYRAQMIRVQRVILYPQRQGDRDDLAVLELSRPVDLNNHVQPVCAWPQPSVSWQGAERRSSSTRPSRPSRPSQDELHPVCSSSTGSWNHSEYGPFHGIQMDPAITDSRSCGSNSRRQGEFCTSSDPYSRGYSSCHFKPSLGSGLLVKQRVPGTEQDVWSIAGIYSRSRGNNQQQDRDREEEYFRRDRYDCGETIWTDITRLTEWLRQTIFIDGAGALTTTTTTTTTPPPTTTEPPLPLDCGIRTKEHRADQKDIEFEQWPWVVPMYEQASTRTGFSIGFRCVGTLLSPNHILTTASCLKTYNQNVEVTTKPLLAQAGRILLTGYNQSTSQPRTINRVYVYPGYNVTGTPDPACDMAMLVIARGFELIRELRPICLWENSQESEGQFETSIVGWAKDEDGNVLSPWPKRTSLEIASDQLTCRADNASTRTHPGPKQLCSKAKNGFDACSHSSGSGMFVKRGSTWQLMGMVTTGPVYTVLDECDASGALLATDLRDPGLISWIQSTMGEELPPTTTYPPPRTKRPRTTTPRP